MSEIEVKLFYLIKARLRGSEGSQSQMKELSGRPDREREERDVIIHHKLNGNCDFIMM